MNNSQGALHFGAGVDLQEWRRNMAEMRRDILGLNQTTQQQTRQMDTSFRTIGLGIGTYFSGAALGNFANQVIRVRGEFQKTEIAFGTMLKSTEKAKALMGQMVDLAAKTPFSLQDVSDGAKRLLAFQIPAEQVVDTLTRIGNVAAGLGVPMGQLIHVYGQVKAQGRLMTNDLYQFMNAGIPMTAELAKVMGVAETEVKDLISAGKIGFPQVQQVINNLTNEGGMFFDLMAKQSESLSGQIANMGDAWDQMLNNIGKSSEGFLSGAIREATFLIENYNGVIDVVKGLIISYGAYRAALIVTAVAQNAAALSAAGMTASQITASGAARVLTAAQATLNATILANPYALAAAALAGLVYAIVEFTTQLSTAQELQQELDDRIKESNIGIAEHQGKIMGLIAAIRSENTTNDQKKKLLDQLNVATNNKIKGLTIEAIRTGNATDAIKAYIAQLKQQAIAMADVEQLKSVYRKRSEAEEVRDRARKGDTSIGEAFSALFDKDTYSNGGIKNVVSSSHWSKAIEHQKNEEIKALDKSVAELEARIQKRGVATVEAETSATDTVVDNINKGAEKKSKAKTAEIEKVYGADTLKGLQQRISRFNEIMETSAFGSEKYYSAKSQKEALESRLKAMTSSFEEELNEIKRQIEVRDKLLKAGYDKTTVDEMFPQIKDQSFLQYLEKLGSEIEKRPLSEMKEDLIILQNVLNDYTGAETFIDNVNKQIEIMKAHFSGNELIEKLEKFKRANLEGTTGDEINAKNIAIEKAKADELERQKANYEAFLKEKETFEQKKAAIDKKYDQIDAAINGSNNSADEKARLLAESGKSRGKEYSAAFLEGLQNTEMWQKAFGDIAEMTNREIRNNIESLKIKVKEATANGATADEIKVLQDRIIELQNVLNNNPFEKIRYSIAKLGEEGISTEGKLNAVQDMFSALGEGVMMIGDALGGFDEATEEAIGNIMEVGNAAFELGKSIASGDVAGMIMSGIKLIGSIGKAISGDGQRERNIKRYTEELRELERVLASLNRTISKTIDNSYFDVSKAAIDNLRAQQAKLRQMINEEQGKKDADSGKIQDYQNQIAAIDNSIEDMIQNMADKIMAGMDAQSIMDKLSDALVTAFENGEDAALAMGRTVDQILREMVINALKMKILAPVMDDVVKQIMASMGYGQTDNSAEINSAQATLAQLEQELANTSSIWGTKKHLELQAQIIALKAYIESLKSGQGVEGAFDGLTEEERQKIKDMIANASNEFTNALEQYEDLFGDAAGAAMGMKGDIKGITEKTAGALEGQLNAMRINVAESLKIHQANKLTFEKSLQNLIAIEWNTRHLIKIQKDIAEMNDKMSKKLAGIP